MSGQTGCAPSNGVQTLWQSLGDWARQSTLAPARPTVGAIVSVLLCTSYQTLITSRLLFAGTALDGNAYSYTRDWYGALFVAFITIGAAVLLIWRSPCSAALPVRPQGSRPPGSDRCGRSWRSARSSTRRPQASSWNTWVSSSPRSPPPRWPSRRSVHGWQRSRQHALEEERRSQQLVRQRDRAVSRTRIAAELHDSVGHGLTTIIALAEGLADVTGDPDLDEALAGINSVAGESLDDSRHAVRALADTEEEAGEDAAGKLVTDLSTSGDPSHGSMTSPHEWAEILPVLGRVRSLGVTVVFTETGRRSPDTLHADLCFAVTREAITNAMRHGNGLRQLSVSWDHDADRVTTVTVRSTAGPESETTGCSAPSPTGTGLHRLQLAVEEAGGTMSYGWAAVGEWVVTAVVRAPSDTARATPPNRSAPREENP